MDLIKYAFDTEGVRKFTYTGSLEQSNVVSINVRSEGDQILIDLEVEKVFDGDDLTNFHEIVLKLSAAFGFEYGIPARNIRYCGHSLPKRNGGRNLQINAGPLRFSIVRTPIVPDANRLDPLLQFSTELADESMMYLRQFTFANSEPDAISRYSFLYNLLLHLSGDKQAKVDSRILEVDPDCKQSTNPNSGKPETKYTKLRNEIAHKRVGAKYGATKKTIEKEVKQFSSVVKQIVLKKIDENC